MANSHNADTSQTHDVDPDIVAMWLRRDPVRWVSGLMAGFLAGVIAMVLAMIFAKIGGMEIWFPIKLMGAVVLGPSATEIGMNMTSIVGGFLLIEALCMFWGFVYSHFVPTNTPGPLLAMGLVWGVFLWVFNWNLYLHSVATIRVADVSAGLVFFVCVAYGLSLSSVAFFDRAFRR